MVFILPEILIKFTTNNRLGYILLILLFVVLMYTPFFFSILFIREIRVALFFLLNFVLIIFYYNGFTKNDLLYLFFLSLYILNALSSELDDASGLLTLGNYSLSLIFFWQFYKVINNNTYLEKALLFYLITSYFFAISTIASFFYAYIFGGFSLFGIQTNSYFFTPFGAIFPKNFFGFEIYRSSSFFYEPIYAGILFLINIYFISPYLTRGKLFFIRVNEIAGALTFSTSFYILYFIYLIFFKIRFSNSSKAMLIILLLTCSIIYPITDLTSLDDRIERLHIFYEILIDSNVSQILFGHGILTPNGYSKAFNSGISLSLFETGIIGLITSFFIVLKIIKRMSLIILFIIICILFDPIKSPLYLLSFALSSCLYEKTKIK